MPRTTTVRVRPGSGRAPRGLAMLLVLVSLATATIITSAYVASRDNSAAIGANVTAAASARWAAASGLELGLVMLQTDADWRTAHVNGRLLDGLAIGHAAVRVDVIDVLTGLPPDDTTRVVELTAVASVDGLEQSSSAVAEIMGRLGGDGRADVDLSEFVLFGRDGIELRDNAIVTRWSKDGTERLAARLALGVSATTAGSVELQQDAAVVDGTVYHGPDASASLILNANGPVLTMAALPGDVPVAMPPQPRVDPDEARGTAAQPLNLNGGLTPLAGTNVRRFIYMMGSATAVLPDGATLVSQQDLTVSYGSRVLVEGDVQIVVLGDLAMENGSIELADDATLRIHVAGNVDLRESFVGHRAAGEERRSDGLAPAAAVDRVTIYSLDDGSGATTSWLLDRASVVKGELYAPLARIRVGDGSALYGRALARHVRVDGESAVYYDPTLDEHRGFTSTYSALYDANGDFRVEYLDLGSLDSAELLALAEATESAIETSEGTYGTSPTSTAVGKPTGGATTPRPVIVEYELRTYGTDVRGWEATGASVPSPL